MKILHTVESYTPAVGGMQEVVRQLSERLVALGHDVTVSTSFNPVRKDSLIQGVKIEQFRISGKAVTGYQASADEMRRYQNLLTDPSFEIVVNFAAQQWATDLALPVLDQIQAKKVMVPTGFSGLFDPQYSDYFKQMALHMKKYDMQVFLSDNYRDINFAREHDIRKLVIIPNGAGADEFLPESKTDIRAQLGIPATDFLILHIGSYTGIKGHREAADIFLHANISNSTLLLIGFQNDYFKKVFERSMHYLWLRFRNRRKNKNVQITFLSRAETVAAYKAADLFLFPSNIECSPIVLFESMAARTPFLTTDVGNSKEIISWSDAGLMLPTRIDEDGLSRAEIKGSAKMLEEVYADAGKRDALAAAGYTAWKSKFSWEIISKQYESLYLQLLKP